MAFKHAKRKQTDWNVQGKNIADTAAPLYQKNLTRMDDYLSDPTAQQDMYLNKYFGANSAQNNDLLRNFKRAMGQTTANNYSATQGGYSSSGQRAYDDNQRYWNDAVSRLQGNNVTNAYNMANQDYQNMLSANNSYYNAYGLGKAYSDVDQYNDMADQANRNWYSGIMSGVGSALMNSKNPIGMAIGGALSLGGSLTGSDAESQLYGGVQGNTRGTDTSNLAGAFQTGSKGIGMLYDKWKNHKTSDTNNGGLFDSNSAGYWKNLM